MFAYLDDSGDTGMKFGRGSTRYVVMSACVFQGVADVDDAWNRLECARHVTHDAIHFQSFDREFKYNKTSDHLKDSFFDKMSGANYSVWAIICDKTTLMNPYLKANPNDIKSFLIQKLFARSNGHLRNVKLFIDGQDTRAFGLCDRDYLMGTVNGKEPGTLRDVYFVDSKQNPMIQLADMTSGAIHAIREKGDPASYKRFESFAERLKSPKGRELVLNENGSVAYPQ